MANSSSTSSKSEITCIQPLPMSRSAPAIAASSASAASSVGIERPSNVLWFSVREVEKPRAPALIPSAASRAISARSCSVAGSRSAPRSPMTNTRSAACGTCVAMSMS